MRTVTAIVCTVLTTFLFAATASAQGVGDRIRALHEAAQFDRARAGEFRKLANEDTNVAQTRENQSRDLDNNANHYAERANFHRAMAAQFGNNRDQLRLANECSVLAGELHKMADERRRLVGSLRAHVNTYNQWANNLDARARSYDDQANLLQSAGRL